MPSRRVLFAGLLFAGRFLVAGCGDRLGLQQLAFGGWLAAVRPRH